MHSRIRKLCTTLVTVALVGGLTAIVAPPAQAAPPFASQNFNPQNTLLFTDFGANFGNGGCTPGNFSTGCNVPDTLLLSDKFDGIDTLAHITSVATTDTTRAIYVICPPGTGTGGTGPVPRPGCDVIGVDDTGEPAGGFQGDEGYEFFWNIPFQYDEVNRDFWSYHCVGLPTNNEPGGNCRLEVEPNVFIDDAQTASNSSAAELLDYCIDVGGDNDCHTNPANAPDPGDVPPKPFDHPEDVPNLGTQYAGATVIVRARASADVGTLTLCRDTNADAQNPPDRCSFSDSSGGAAAGAFNNYTYFITYPDNAEMAWFLYDRTGGTGACAGNDDDETTGGTDEGDSCLLDTHYVVSSEPRPVQAVGTFNPNPPSPPANASCANPDKDETNSLNDSEGITICFTDQFGNPTQAEGTLESTGVGHFSACTGTLHDHDGDGQNEHCHVRTDATGRGFATINNPTFTPGDQTILVCADPQNDRGVVSPGNPPSAGHGCGDETVTDTLNKHWRTLPEHIHLVFSGTGDPADPCHTGDTFKENNVGDVDDLLACAFDDTPAHNPATTDQPNGGRLQWRIAPSGGGELTATRFQTPPPSETGPDGRATANIESFRPGNDLIEVQLIDEFGNIVATADVQKRVTTTGPEAECNDGLDNDNDDLIDFPADPGCNRPEDDSEENVTRHGRTITINFAHARNPRGGRTLIVSGRVSVPDGFNACRRGVPVNVQRFVRGQGFVTRKTDTTGRRGKYSVEIQDLRGDYRAEAQRVTEEDQQGNVDICRRATARGTHRHRR